MLFKDRSNSTQSIVCIRNTWEDSLNHRFRDTNSHQVTDLGAPILSNLGLVDLKSSIIHITVK